MNVKMIRASSDIKVGGSTQLNRNNNFIKKEMSTHSKKKVNTWSKL